MTIVLHNTSGCASSCNGPAITGAFGTEPLEIEHLQIGRIHPQRQGLCAAKRVTPGDALGMSKSRTKTFGLLDVSGLGDVLRDAMGADPVLVNRRLPPGPLCWEEGRMILFERGERFD